MFGTDMRLNYDQKVTLVSGENTAATRNIPVRTSRVPQLHRVLISISVRGIIEISEGCREVSKFEQILKRSGRCSGVTWIDIG